MEQLRALRAQRKDLESERKGIVRKLILDKIGAKEKELEEMRLQSIQSKRLRAEKSKERQQNTAWA